MLKCYVVFQQYDDHTNLYATQLGRSKSGVGFSLDTILSCQMRIELAPNQKF